MKLLAMLVFSLCVYASCSQQKAKRTEELKLLVENLDKQIAELNAYAGAHGGSGGYQDVINDLVKKKAEAEAELKSLNSPE